MAEVTREVLGFSWLAAACVSFYGFASWIVVNGVWVELPVLVNYLPEGWSLPAYLSIVIQIANLGPLLYLPLTRLCRRVTRTGFWWRCIQPPERIANYVILAVGLVSCVLMAHLWNRTATFDGTPSGTYSFGLLAPAFCASIVDCTSSVTFAAYLTGLPETYMGALQFGEGFSDLVPSTIALIQGVGEDPECVNTTINGTIHITPVYPPPRFSVTAFMYCLAILLVIALIAFSFLDLSPYGLGRDVWHHYMTTVQLSKERKTQHPVDMETARRISDAGTTSVDDSGDEKASSLIDVPVVVYSRDHHQSSGALPLEGNHSPIVYTSPSGRLGIRLLTSEYLLPVGLLAYASFLTYGFLPAFQTYSCASYNSLTYHLAVTLSGVVGAILTVLATYFIHRNKLKQTAFTSASLYSSSSSPDLSLGNHATNWASSSYIRRSQFMWVLLAVLSSIPTAYVIYLACKSPNPPQLGGFGPVLAVLSWIGLRSGFIILRTWLWLHLSSRSHEPTALRYAGLATQIGAAFGAILSFLLVAKFQLFQTKVPCS
ncbi:hypothetical protein CRM22_003350 [Opisthorchis felineus]|uniref:Riboflavin transporter n=1 Tax=Opisthorchis felineus TaxID=147828 RepID=A0A4S2M1N8_OPIFE|nr:hypothetical protein CRM22_003350 [Opisthorchis felineus]